MASVIAAVCQRSFSNLKKPMKTTKQSTSMSFDRFFIYARKSTDDGKRQQRSIGDQLTEVRELAKREGLRVIEELVEKQSAKIPGRPVFAEMLRRIECGEACGIIAWHPDRLSRNPIDTGRLIHLVDQGHILRLRFPTFPFETSAQGKFMLSILLSQSKYYVDSLGENVMRGLRNKVKAGDWPQLAPMGYLNDKVTKKIIVHPINGPIVQKMFELYATGEYGLKDLQDTVIKLGLRSARACIPSQSVIQDALQNPLYCGLLRFKGETFEGKHTPLITRALFDKCQAVMTERSRPRKTGFKTFIYRGMIRCGECGGMITMEEQKGHHYLRCTKKRGLCDQPYLREEEVRGQITEALEDVAISDELERSISKELDVMAMSDARTARDQERRLRDEVCGIDQRLRRLMDAMLDEVITQDEYKQQKDELLAEKRRLLDQLFSLQTKGGANWLEPVKRFLKDCAAASSVAVHGNPLEQWRFFRNVGSNLILRDRRLQWAPRGAWQLVRIEDVAGRGESARTRAQYAEWAEKRELTVKLGI
jgi:site-specific DNA recombinase